MTKDLARSTAQPKPIELTALGVMLMVGDRHAVKVEAIDHYENVGGNLTIRLRGGQSFVARMRSFAEFHAAMTQVLGRDVVLGGRMEHASIELSNAEQTAVSAHRVKLISLGGMYTGSEQAVVLESIDAFEVRNGAIQLHLRHGRTLAFPLEHWDTIEAAVSTLFPILRVDRIKAPDTESSETSESLNRWDLNLWERFPNLRFRH